MVRLPHDLPGGSVVDVVDDGLTLAQVAELTVDWLSALEGVPVVALPVCAADELRSAYADNDV